MMPKAQEGDTVTVIYQALLEDGSVFDGADEDAPLVFILGEGDVLPGFELAVLGMQVGERKIVQVPPEEGYGLHEERLVDEIALEVLPKELILKVGNLLEVTGEDGTQYRLQVVDLDGDRVTLDANHPLAGHSLTFQIELVDIDRPTIN
jgi:peptidylprolyl isomerase